MEEEAEVTAGSGSAGRGGGKAPSGRSPDQAYREIGYRGIAAAREQLRQARIAQLDKIEEPTKGEQWVESET
jgi:hypothetical protein